MGLTPGNGLRAVEAMTSAASAVAQLLSRSGEAVTRDPADLSRYDRFVDGLNRLPRPLLALWTFGLFGYAMLDPEGFARRMEGMAQIPEPLWWLLGAVVSFHFGAREAYYLRSRHAPRVDTPFP